eukprot:gene945-259_t
MNLYRDQEEYQEKKALSSIKTNLKYYVNYVNCFSKTKEGPDFRSDINGKSTGRAVFFCVFKASTVPRLLKRALITPIYKSKGKSCPANLALTSHLVKVLEKNVRKIIVAYMPWQDQKPWYHCQGICSTFITGLILTMCSEAPGAKNAVEKDTKFCMYGKFWKTWSLILAYITPSLPDMVELHCSYGQDNGNCEATDTYSQ